MALRLLSFLCLLFIIPYCAPESTNDLISNNYYPLNSHDTLIFTHPLHFISHICQRQEQYPIELTNKFCAKYIQSQEEKQQQQRGKRVGWTISV
jgi:hypothetical protein